ncbi:MAG: Hsp20/alpha crystallin family protein [Deltaproteobacteria bacterium]|nr:Hsp20/alpha crystallin family protein [Deltaproteobacteria bacterium]
MRSLIPWRWKEVPNVPDNALTEFRKEVDDLFNNFFGNADWLPGTYFNRGFTPVFDVSETDEDILIKAELPGIDPKDIEVNLTGNTITVKGEKKEEREEKGENMHRVERSFGSFSRSLTLPCDVKQDNIEANFKHGVLNLKLPKSESSRKRSIKIDVK